LRELGIGNIAVHELEQFIPFQRIEIGSITGIGKRIEHNDAVGWMQVSPMQNEIGADTQRRR
jgi:hypothetical protein